MTTPATPQTAANSSYVPPRDDALTQLVAAFIDKRWDSHYRAAWTKLGSPEGLRPGGNWNWAAAFFCVPWLAYRRQWAIALGIFLGSFLAGVLPFGGLIAAVGCFVGFGLYGDRIVLKRAWQSADAALRQYGPSDSATRQVRAAGGTSTVALIIFLIFPAVIIIGIMAAIAIPKFASTKNRAYVTEMRADLISLKTAEEIYFTDSTQYTANLALLHLQPSQGVSQPQITLDAKHAAYSATVTHAQVNTTCAIAVGMPNPLGIGGEGEPVCKER